METYIQRLDFNKKEDTCRQCNENCEDLDNYYLNPNKCIMRQSEKNKKVIKK